MERKDWDQESVVAAWMAKLADAQPRHRLPDPDLLWMRAQLSNRQVAAARALQVLEIGEILISIVVAAGAAWLVMNWVKIQTSLVEIETASRPGGNPWPLLLLSLAGAALMAFVARALQPLLTRDED